MEDAPLLKADGALVYSSPDAFRRHYQKYLEKGGALVRPEVPLRPLETVQVRIALPTSEVVVLEAQVTSLAGPFCLLHFVDLPPTLAERLRQAADATEPNAYPPPPIADGTEGPAADPPSEALLREVAALVAEIPPEEPSPELPPRPPPPMPVGVKPPSPAPPPPAPPPAGPAFVLLDSPPAPSPAPPPSAPAFVLLDDLPPSPRPAPPAQAPGAPAYPTSPAPPPPGAPSAQAAAIASVPLLFKEARTFKNPATPQEFLSLPLLRLPPVDQVPEPSTPLLIQWLSALKAPAISVRLLLGRSRDVQLYALFGQELRSSTPVDSLVRALGEPSGRMEIRQLPEGPKAPFSAPLASTRFAVLRELLKRYSEADLTTGLSERLGMSPKLNAHGMGLLRVLGLSESQLRMSQRLLGGQHPLDVVLNNGIGVRSTWQVLYLQQLLGGLSWVDPPPRENVVVEELRATAERVRAADHFEALGLHYTSPPRAVERAFERMRREYGPASPAATQSGRLADEIWQRAQQAYEALKTAPQRKQYRKDRFPNVRMDYASQIVLSQSQLAEMRGELDLAIDLLEAAIELSPSAELVANLRRVQAKKSGVAS